MIKTSEYKGHNVISLMDKEDEKYPFSFGIKKARLILLNIKEIALFVEGFADKEIKTEE